MDELFIEYVGNGDLENLKKFKDEQNFTKNVYDYAFGLAARKGHLEVCQWLMQFNPDIHAENSCAFIRAAVYGHLEVCEWLMQFNPDVRADNDYAFRWAADYKHLEILKCLWLQTNFDKKILKLKEVKKYIDELEEYEWQVNRDKTAKSARK